MNAPTPVPDTPGVGDAPDDTVAAAPAPPDRPATAGNGRPRSPGARDAVAAALASGATVKSAAAAARVGERTVRRWAHDPRFAARVAGLRREAMAAGMSRVIDRMAHAGQTLGALLDAPDDRVRLQAARAVLDAGLRAFEAMGLEDRVRELEARAGLGPPAPPIPPPGEWTVEDLE